MVIATGSSGEVQKGKKRGQRRQGRLQKGADRQAESEAQQQKGAGVAGGGVRTLSDLLAQLGLQGGQAVLLGQAQAVGVQPAAASRHEGYLLLHPTPTLTTLHNNNSLRSQETSS